MNCPKCGAPLRHQEGRGHLQCDFCASIQLLDRNGISSDGVVSLGEEVAECCPVCSGHLTKAVLDGVTVLFCHDCRGLLLANDAFAEIVQNRRARYDNAPITPPPFDPTELDRKIKCPHCHRHMDTYAYYGPGNVVIDGCPRCHLVWCDHGEVTVIEKAPGRR